MLVTLSGMIVFWHPAINVLDDVSIMALHPSRESYTGLFADTVMDVRERQLLNAPTPMRVTFSGMDMDVREEQP